jgi:hypothetical protein
VIAITDGRGETAQDRRAGHDRPRGEEETDVYIFSRSAALDHNRPMETAAAAVEVAGLVSDVTGLEIGVFMSRYGEPTNVVRWSCRVDSQSELQAATDKLAGNEKYLAWIAANPGLAEGAATDQLGRIVSASNIGDTTRRFYAVLGATAANGRLADAMAFGVRAEQFMGSTTGLTTVFLSNVYGAYGGVTWLTGADSMDAFDELAEMQATNAEFQALVADAGDLFLAGSGVQGLIEKIG